MESDKNNDSNLGPARPPPNVRFASRMRPGYNSKKKISSSSDLVMQAMQPVFHSTQQFEVSQISADPDLPSNHGLNKDSGDINSFINMLRNELNSHKDKVHKLREENAALRLSKNKLTQKVQE